MTKRRANEPAPGRAELERQLSADIRAITARSDRVGRHFARVNEVSSNDFHALLHIMVSETAGVPLTLAQLRQRMDVSPAAITYLVDRMIAAGHIRREPDPEDRRKWLLRYQENGMSLAHQLLQAPRRPSQRGDGRPQRQGPRCRSSGVHGDDRRDDHVRGRARQAAHRHRQPASGAAARLPGGRKPRGSTRCSNRCSIRSAPRATPPVAANPAAPGARLDPW